VQDGSQAELLAVAGTALVNATTNFPFKKKKKKKKKRR
jgi:hypothetical protein